MTTKMKTIHNNYLQIYYRWANLMTTCISKTIFDGSDNSSTNFFNRCN